MYREILELVRQDEASCCDRYRDLHYLLFMPVESAKVEIDVMLAKFDENTGSKFSACYQPIDKCVHLAQVQMIARRF